MQDFFRRTFNDVSVKLTITNAVAKATDANHLSLDPVDSRAVLNLALEHPKATLLAIRSKLTPAKPATAHLALQLLEDCVNCGNSVLHEALESDLEIHASLLTLATRRGTDPSSLQLQRTARRVVLEVARMFEATGVHPTLAGLVSRYEAATGKQLLRSVVLETRRVKVHEPGPESIRWISPVRREPKSNIRQRDGGADQTREVQTTTMAATALPATVPQSQQQHQQQHVLRAVALPIAAEGSNGAGDEFAVGTVVGTSAVDAVPTGHVVNGSVTPVAAHVDPSVDGSVEVRSIQPEEKPVNAQMVVMPPQAAGTADLPSPKNFSVDSTTGLDKDEEQPPQVQPPAAAVVAVSTHDDSQPIETSAAATLPVPIGEANNTSQAADQAEEPVKESTTSTTHSPLEPTHVQPTQDDMPVQDHAAEHQQAEVQEDLTIKQSPESETTQSEPPAAADGTDTVQDQTETGNAESMEESQPAAKSAESNTDGTNVAAEAAAPELEGAAPEESTVEAVPQLAPAPETPDSLPQEAPTADEAAQDESTEAGEDAQQAQGKRGKKAGGKRGGKGRR
jgi:hypothetical protein